MGVYLNRETPQPMAFGVESMPLLERGSIWEVSLLQCAYALINQLTKRNTTTDYIEHIRTDDLRGSSGKRFSYA